MNAKMMRWVILLASIAIAGIILSQAFWIRKGLLINQSNFDNAVINTLSQICYNLEKKALGEVRTLNPVIRISPRSYILNLDIPMDVNFLANQFSSEFTNPFHKIDFTYEVYESETRTLVFADTIFIQSEKKMPSKYLPNLTESTYYCKINFPERPIVPSIMISIWGTAIIILTSVIIFFAYTLHIILRQRRQSEFQKSFINNLAHEFKTPISTINISSHVLQEDGIVNEPERLKNYAIVIENEVNRLRNQVNKILEIASLETNEMTLSLEEFDINQLTHDIVAAFEVSVKKRNGMIVLTHNSDSCIIYADKVHFINVVNTLLDNALKYSDENPYIELETDCNETRTTLKVKDRGVGIPKEFQKRIFDKFFRVPTGDVHNVKGFGLGLNYVKMVAKAHKWQLTVDSEVNKGSIFTIIFPKK
ncbi:MAG: sensor histidine kinase [Chitinophagales bacterium]